MKRFVGFDIETSTFPTSDEERATIGWNLGITCAAWSNGTHAKRYYGENFAPRMSRPEAGRMVDDLLRLHDQGYTIFTWNGAGFDFRVLAAESGRDDDCRYLALRHVDGMLHFLQVHAYPTGLKAVSAGIGLRKTINEADTENAPSLWREGKFDTVLQYVENDATISYEVAERTYTTRTLKWITSRGVYRERSWPGWLLVEDILKLPAPAPPTWMKDPLTRDQFVEWLL